MLRPGNRFTKSLDPGEDGFCSGDPGEGTGILIVALDKIIDPEGQFPDVGERTAANGLLRNETEPPFHVMDPCVICQVLVCGTFSRTVDFLANPPW